MHIRDNIEPVKGFERATLGHRITMILGDVCADAAPVEPVGDSPSVSGPGWGMAPSTTCRDARRHDGRDPGHKPNEPGSPTVTSRVHRLSRAGFTDRRIGSDRCTRNGSCDGADPRSAHEARAPSRRARKIAGTIAHRCYARQQSSSIPRGDPSGSKRWDRYPVRQTESALLYRRENDGTRTGR